MVCLAPEWETALLSSTSVTMEARSDRFALKSRVNQGAKAVPGALSPVLFYSSTLKSLSKDCPDEMG